MFGKPIDAIGFVNQYDPEIALCMNKELLRQRTAWS